MWTAMATSTFVPTRGGPGLGMETAAKCMWISWKLSSITKNADKWLETQLLRYPPSAAPRGSASLDVKVVGHGLTCAIEMDQEVDAARHRETVGKRVL